MPVERSFISSDQEAQTIQPQQEIVDAGLVQEGLGRRLKRSRQYGALLAVILAPSIAWGGYVRNENHNGESAVRSLQTQTKPQFWGKMTDDANFPPVYNYHDGIAHKGLSSVGAVYYGPDYQTGAPCTITTNSWVTEQTFPIDPNKTYTESLWEEHTIYDLDSQFGPSDIGPLVIVNWEDLNGVSIYPSISDLLPDHSTTTTTWSKFTRTIGPEQIPSNAVSATLIVAVQPYNSKVCVSTGNGVVNYDDVYFGTSPAESSKTNLINNSGFEKRQK
jgi:hypothetical protein